MKKGFTIVEIIISVTLIAIIGVFSFITVNKYHNNEDEKFLKDLKNDVIVFLNTTKHKSNRIELTPGNHIFIKLS